MFFKRSLNIFIYSLFLVFIFFFQWSTAFCQPSGIDSLLSLLKTDRHDTSKITHLNNLCSEYRLIGKYDSAFNMGMAALDIGKKILANGGNPKELNETKSGIAASYNNLGIVTKEQGNYSEALDYYFSSLKIYEEMNDKKGSASVLGNLGGVYRNQGDFPKALDCYYKAIKINEELGDKSGLSDNYLRIGIVYENQGDYPKALNNYFDALKVYEELVNKPRIALALGNIGVAYSSQNNYPKALEYYLKALEIDEELGNKSGIARHFGNIGIIYKEQCSLPIQRGDSTVTKETFTKSLEYFFKALKLSEEIGYKQMQAATLGNIGALYMDNGGQIPEYFNKDESYNKALEYCFRALKIYEEMGDMRSISINLGSIGSLYTKQKKYELAEKYLMKSLLLSDSIGTLFYKKIQLQFLSELYEKTNRHQLSLEYFKKAMILKDTLYNQEKEKDITRKEMNYEFEKKEAATQAEHDKQLALSEAEKKKQQIIILSVVAGLFLVALILIIVVRSLRITQRQKSVIEKQKEIVDEQRKTVEEKNSEISRKNKELTDSINYAQRIQSAILTSEQYLSDMFLPHGQTASHFILYKPKDIVAGDFYWAFKTQSGKAIWVTADCTGHGVPGAFMSMIGNSLLNEIVVEKKIYEPDEILNYLREGIIKALGQGIGQDEKRKDGMDAAVCVWDRTISGGNGEGSGGGNNKGILKFSGANNCLWVVRNTLSQPGSEHSEVIELKPDSQPVGQHVVMNPFTKRELYLHTGDALYMFTDGYCDQFGGPKGKKFKYKPFKELLVSIQQKTMPEQKIILDKTICDWSKELEQVDDICVFGVRI